MKVAVTLLMNLSSACDEGGMSGADWSMYLKNKACSQAKRHQPKISIPAPRQKTSSNCLLKALVQLGGGSVLCLFQGIESSYPVTGFDFTVEALHSSAPVTSRRWKARLDGNHRLRLQDLKSIEGELDDVHRLVVGLNLCNVLVWQPTGGVWCV